MSERVNSINTKLEPPEGRGNKYFFLKSKNFELTIKCLQKKHYTYFYKYDAISIIQEIMESCLKEFQDELYCLEEIDLKNKDELKF